MYPIYVLSKNKKNIKNFHLKIIIFTAVKYCCILHGHVCVMCTWNQSSLMKDPNRRSTFRIVQTTAALCRLKPICRDKEIYLTSKPKLTRTLSMCIENWTLVAEQERRTQALSKASQYP